MDCSSADDIVALSGDGVQRGRQKCPDLVVFYHTNPIISGWRRRSVAFRSAKVAHIRGANGDYEPLKIVTNVDDFFAVLMKFDSQQVDFVQISIRLVAR